MHEYSVVDSIVRPMLDAIQKQGAERADATQIGEVAAGTPGLVTLRSQIGARRILDLLSGEQFPRIF